ncbi:MAG: LysR family transcriptional regulator [Selenomonas sp.]|uniref:LysR family transcriptional regulator n=1 Tax=Selenomonas sp. TaxID=2053611 RepID=UPI0025D8183E|nr:LysR family transcriptional regulator [Selenomonas sp.]MCR5757959.1 LysR family transcriptional regulator [Selenomonas sp.]
MNIKQLEYFIAAYRSRNIQAAADKLYVTRQGISKIIRQLEQNLGQTLFTRTPRGLEPTDYAIALLPHAQRLLEDYHYIEGLNTLAAQSKNVVTVYALDHVLAYLGAQFLLDFHTVHPDIILSVIDTTDDAALEGLAAKKCNFAIVTGPLDNSRFHGEGLFFSRYCVRLHKDHPLASKTCIDYEDLDGTTIIGKGRAYQCFRHNMDKYIFLPGRKVTILGETADEQIITELVAKNQAISIGYDYSAIVNQHPDILLRPLASKDENGQHVYLVTDNHTLSTTATRKFQQFLLDWLPAHHKDKIEW